MKPNSKFTKKITSKNSDPRRVINFPKMAPGPHSIPINYALPLENKWSLLPVFHGENFSLGYDLQKFQKKLRI
jgi:hypothetical protein